MKIYGQVEIKRPWSALTAAFLDFRGHAQQIRWRGLFQNIVQCIQTHLQHLSILLLQEMTKRRGSVIVRTFSAAAAAAAPTREDG
jgi:hypothetical protein